MWPKLLDMSRDECKRLLRRMELEAYAGIISAFRAQGALTEEKKTMLNDLCNMLSISTERHRAEIRRAVNDEKYATIAEHLAGSNTGAEWAIEGRRLIPLLPRLVPQTSFTIAANQAANLAHAQNMMLLPPSETTRKEVTTPTGSSPANGKPARCPSPSSGMVVLPSGLSIPIKSPSDLSDNENTLPPPAKRKRSNSMSSALKSELPSPSSMLPGPKPTSMYATGSNVPSTSKITTGYVTQSMHAPPSGGQGSPVKITFTKGSGTAGQQSVPLNSAQKVIIVSSGNTSYNTPTILQRSQSHLASRALSTMSSGMQHVSAPAAAGSKQPVVLTTIPGQHGGMMHHGLTAGSSGMGPLISAGKSYTSATSAIHDPSIHPSMPSNLPINPAMHSMPRGPRPKVYNKQKVVKPFSIIGGGTGGGGGPQSGIAGGITMTTPSPSAAGKKPTIHIKQESAGVKIITQTMGGPGKMVPKPITISTTSGGSVVMVTCVPSSMVMSGKPMVTSGGTIIHQGGQMRSVYGSGTRYITGPAGMHGGAKPSMSGSNVITVSPKALQTALAKGATPSTVVVSKPSSMGSGKANVIVVQKSQMVNPKTVSIQRSLSSPEVQKHLMTGTSSFLTRPKISMVTTTSSMMSSPMSPTVRFPVPPHQRGLHGGVTMATSMTMTPVVGGHQMPGPSSVIGGKVPVTVAVTGSPKAGQDITSRAAQVVIRSKTSLSQPGQPTRRRSGSPASSVPFLEFPSQLNPIEGERLTRVTVQRRSASVSPTRGQSSQGVVIDEGGTVTRITSHDPPGQQVPMLFHTSSARQPNREWIDYDGNPPEQSASSAIKALLEFRAQPQSGDASRQRQPTTLDLGHLGKVAINQAGKAITTTTLASTGRPMPQHIMVKKGAITGPFPAPMRPVIQQRTITPPMTTSPSVFTGSQTMMSAQQFRGKQVFTDLKRNPSSFLQSATMEVEKALQEQNKTYLPRDMAGALTHKPPSRGMELSATLPRLTHPVTTPAVKAQPTQQLQRPSKPPTVTIEDQGVVSEHMELSPAEVNSFIDQFERFLESEGLESEMEGSEKLRAVARSQREKAASMEKKSKAVTIQVPKSGGMTPGEEPFKKAGHAAPSIIKKVVLGVAGGSSTPVPVVTGGSSTVPSVSSGGAGSSGSGGNMTWQNTYAQSLQQQKQQVAQKIQIVTQPVKQQVIKPTISESSPSAVSSEESMPTSSTTPTTTVESAVHVVTGQKGSSSFSTLHEMLSKGKGATVVEPVATTAAASAAATTVSAAATATASAAATTASVTVVPTIAPSSGQAKPVVTSVVVESSRFDASQMKMEDFTSQRLQDDFDVTAVKQDDIPSVSSNSPTPSQKSPGRSEGLDVSLTGSGSLSEESESLDAQLGIRSSKRKRKAPIPIDEDVGPMCMPSWARAALNLLHRVMRFRGANRSKGDLNAASWFTRPVDPSEAPGYMQLIKVPMDFSTIKKKLENNQYNDLSEFHNDMMLVRGNCHLYNPPGHEARKDCEEVFQFYTAEYGKVLDRMQKALLFNTPRSPKKTIGHHKDGSSSPSSASSPVSATSPVSASARSSTPTPASTAASSHVSPKKLPPSSAL